MSHGFFAIPPHVFSAALSVSVSRLVDVGVEGGGREKRKGEEMEEERESS
jgi:hypothetical protein